MIGGDRAGLVDDVERIVVLRANGLGDLMFALPALDALRAAYPQARITLAGLAWHRELLWGRPSPVDRVVALPRAPGGRLGDLGPRGEARALAALRGGVDLAVQLHGGGRRANPWVQALGARVSIGLRSSDAMALDRWVRFAYYQPEVLRYLEVVSLAGALPVTVAPHLAVTEADHLAARDALAALGDLDQPLVVLNPGATDPRRRWPVESFAALADRLAQQGARVVLSGSAGDDEMLAESIRHLARVPIWSLVGRLSLPALVGVLARADLVISNDSGPLHLAAAVGTDTVGIYWCGNLVNGGPLQVDRHRQATSWRIHCPLCGAPNLTSRCGHDESFVADVPIAEAAAAADDLCQTRPGGQDGAATASRRI